MEPLIFVPPNEVITPDSIDWWPPSLALIGLIIAAIALVTWIVIVIKRYRAAFAARRQAVSELHTLLTKNTTNNTANNTDTSYQLAMVNQILKRVALHYYPSESANIALLHGQDWSTWLCDKMTSKSIKQASPDYAASLLLLNQSMYQSAAQLPTVLTLPTAIDIAQMWCKKGLPRFNVFTMQLSAPRSGFPIGAIKHG
jgi:hypothetical protein